MNRAERRFHAAWILANGLAEGLGLSSTLLLAHFSAGMLQGTTPGAGAILLGAAVAVVLGTLLEGTLVGYAQAHVLAARLPSLRARRWIAATSLGAGIAWTLGMVPSTVAALAQWPSEPAGAGAASDEWPTGLMLLLAALMGTLLGPVLALPQWRVMRDFVPRAWRWLPANAAAWMVGMVIVFAGMHQVVWSRGVPATMDAVFTICAVAGLAVGAVHGAVLVRMLRDAEGLTSPGVGSDTAAPRASPR
jgi:hypothetical protein